jgi:hypothetical protein
MKALRVVATVAVLVGTSFSYDGIIDSQLGLTFRALPGQLNLDALWLSNLLFLLAHSLLAGVVAVFAAAVAHFVFPWSSFWGALALTIAIFVSKNAVFVWSLLAFGDSYFRLADLSVLAFFMMASWLTLSICNPQRPKPEM